ncbi:unnamed protein product [Hymenolepis diminuta]|uniref:Parkin coregulated gene protein n=1 Tax=Hymenolepis diminuta TaxID=6216 RepID=A0A0R3SJD8_HYMDI|nr:unnamed protein product [Hymenolepis diminuta]VUZ46436.1 unnamed protein product [Hymenolepis diminuta]
MNSGYPLSNQCRKRSCFEKKIFQSGCGTHEISLANRRSSEICGSKPRRNSLLGIEDPIWKKQTRAFTMQAEQGIWDIGAPEPSMVKKPLRKSLFQERYTNRVYPFHIDYSGSSTLKISWHDDIEHCPIFELMKDTVEAQTDTDHWSNIGFLVFKDLLKHVSPAKLASALPGFSLEFRKAMRRNNEETSRRLLMMLKELALVTTSLGPDLACFAFDLFNHSQQWLHFSKIEVGDRIAYGRPTFNELYDELHTIFEVISGPQKDQAVAGMKRGNPIYQLPTKSPEEPK